MRDCIKGKISVAGKETIGLGFTPITLSISHEKAGNGERDEGELLLAVESGDRDREENTSGGWGCGVRGYS